jgi:hypothetical protein
MKDNPSSDTDSAHPSVLQTITGTVKRVDPVAREIKVCDSVNDLLFDVPPDCPVVLRGERIKFRLIQKGDRVALSYRTHRGANEARRLEVQPDTL